MIGIQTFLLFAIPVWGALVGVVAGIESGVVMGATGLVVGLMAGLMLGAFSCESLDFLASHVSLAAAHRRQFQVVFWSGAYVGFWMFLLSVLLYSIQFIIQKV